MALEYLAGQILTADELQRTVTKRVTQGSSQDVASSTTIVDTSIVIPVDDLIKVNLEVRYQSRAGGIRWAWAESSGSVTLLSRAIGPAPGDGATGNNSELTLMFLRTQITLTEEQLVAHHNTNTSSRISEELIIEGSGEITLQFAQDTSNASATTFNGQSYATWHYLES
jgi:hypothetical protein